METKKLYIILAPEKTPQNCNLEPRMHATLREGNCDFTKKNCTRKTSQTLNHLRMQSYGEENDDFSPRKYEMTPLKKYIGNLQAIGLCTVGTLE